MGKDPAFLFYPGDWLSGTMGMTFEEKGAYMELLMMQFNRGHMTDHMVGQVVAELWLKIRPKFIQDADGLWYNKRLDEEKNKRKKFTISRNNNLLGNNQYTKKTGHLTGHMTTHMESEDIYVLLESNLNGTEDKNKYVMVVIEMMNVWMRHRPGYGSLVNADYPALLNIAYLIAQNKGWKKADVVGGREQEVTESWEKICKYLAGTEPDRFLRGLTIDGISIPKNFQKITEAMRTGKSAVIQKQNELEKDRIKPEDYFKE